ncbi:MAG: NADH-quinone oxidoreductase subunit A [Planctomycetaceae bacterium]|nr:NADH-quinone oxidoreductase subunit A [Planctomycetaceae bacterium]
MMPTAIVAYLALFATVGALFTLVCLLLGKLIRPCAPNSDKCATYECGEPSVGPSSVQFDLRFYVIALVFLIFEVEVAFFFPPAAIFGRANEAIAAQRAAQTTVEKSTTKAFAEKPVDDRSLLSPDSASKLSLAAMLDLGVFFAVLLVGFAYVWRRGDLSWVRAMRHPTTPAENAAVFMRLRGQR